METTVTFSSQHQAPRRQHHSGITALPDDLIILLMQTAPNMATVLNLAYCNRQLYAAFKQHKNSIVTAQREQLLAPINWWYKKLSTLYIDPKNIIWPSGPEGHQIIRHKSMLASQVMRFLPYIGGSQAGKSIGDDHRAINWAHEASTPELLRRAKRRKLKHGCLHRPGTRIATHERHCIWLAEAGWSFWILDAMEAQIHDLHHGQVTDVNEFFQRLWDDIVQGKYIVVAGLSVSSPEEYSGDERYPEYTEEQYDELSAIARSHGWPHNFDRSGMTDMIRHVVKVDGRFDWLIPEELRREAADWERGVMSDEEIWCYNNVGVPQPWEYDEIASKDRSRAQSEFCMTVDRWNTWQAARRMFEGHVHADEPLIEG